MDKLIEIYNMLMASKGDFVSYFVAVGSVVLAAKSITILTPTKVDDKALAGFGKVYNILAKALNVAALNIGKDKNADAE